MTLSTHSKENGFLLIHGLIIIMIIFVHLLVLTKIVTLKIKTLHSTRNYLKCYYAAKTAAQYVLKTSPPLPLTLTYFEMPIYIYEDANYIYIDCTWKQEKAHVMEEKQ